MIEHPKSRIATRSQKSLMPPRNSDDNLLKALLSDWDRWLGKLNEVGGSRILIATSMANYNHASVVERSLAVALTLRGADVEMLLCDRALPACQMTKMHGCEPEALLARDDTPRCDGCIADASLLFDPLGVPVRRLTEYLAKPAFERAQTLASNMPFNEISTYSPDGISIGEHAAAGALRYFGRGDLSGEPHGEAVLRRFLQSALITAEGIKELLQCEQYDVVVFHHGIYIPQGIIGEVCRRHEVRVVNWNPSYRKNTFIFSHGDTYHHTMIYEPISVWQNIRWTEALENLTMEYLESRRHGSSDWIWFHEHPENDTQSLAREFGIDWSKPCIGMLTSVMWDAQLHYRANAFPNMLAWIVHTIEYFRHRHDLQLLIRVHPAEVRGMVPSRQRVTDELRHLVPDMPANVFIVPPEHQASTYALMERCDTALIFNTKTGIELSAIGIPVIVAGEAWIRGKGFSMDATSPESYDNILNGLPCRSRLTQEQIASAKRYAFHFFFRRMLELPFISSPKKYTFSVDVKCLDDFMPNRWRGLDIICNGILRSTPFIDEYETRIKVQ